MSEEAKSGFMKNLKTGILIGAGSIVGSIPIGILEMILLKKMFHIK